MTTLTQTAYYTRRVINWLLLALIAYIILRLAWGLISTVYLSFFPPKPPPPNHAFGKLPTLQFPATATASGQLTFRLETIEGSVPRASDSAVVYFMPKYGANLLALNKATEFANRIDFTADPVAETKNIYRFDDLDNTLRRLRYDIISKNFVLRYAFEKETSLFTDRIVPSADEAAGEARSFLESYGLSPDDISPASLTTQYLRLSGDRLVTTTSLSQADAVRVDFFRKTIGTAPVFTPYPDEGIITFIFSGSRNPKKQILQIAYTYWLVDYQTTATYALKTSAVAWAELQSNNGFIARYPTNSSVAVIRKVYLGYYDSFDPQTYLQPIFVFEGDDGFLAYVPAIDSTWTE